MGHARFRDTRESTRAMAGYRRRRRSDLTHDRSSWVATCRRANDQAPSTNCEDNAHRNDRGSQSDASTASARTSTHQLDAITTMCRRQGHGDTYDPGAESAPVLMDQGFRPIPELSLPQPSTANLSTLVSLSTVETNRSHSVQLGFQDVLAIGGQGNDERRTRAAVGDGRRRTERSRGL